MNSRQQQAPPQQSAAQQYMATLDFTEPPDVHIIEASCALANTRNSTNNKWTNVLKEPLLVKKGSQIRCASSFINMSGMDQEIIQFQPTGDTQDNSHTMLTQLYTCNDGGNGKTTSYDYICHNIQGNALILTNPGAGVTNNQTCNVESIISQGSGATMTVTSLVTYQILDNRVGILSAGTGYSSGDKLIFGTGGGKQTTSPEGFIIANDLGEVKKIVITNRGVYTDFQPSTPITVSVSTATGGSGAVLNIIVPLLGTGALQLHGFTITAPGSDYTIGQVVRIVSTGTQFTDNPLMRIDAVGPGGELLNVQYFDQGYNYARIPVFRWAQTFDFNSSFTYGKKLGNRSFVSGNGNTVSVYNNPPMFTFDKNLSNAFNLGNKEDEFISGLFHKNAQSSTFSIAKATCSIAQDSVGIDFMMRTVGGLSQFTVPNILENYTDSYGKTIPLLQNPLNQFALGQCFCISFGLKNSVPIANENIWNNLQAVAGNFQGLYTVGQKTQYPQSITINGIEYPNGYQTIRIGPPDSFDGGDIGLVPGSNPPQYTNPLKGYPSSYQFGGVDNLTGTPNQVYTTPMINKRREDAAGMTGSGATVTVTLNNAGNEWASFASNNNGTLYKQGDILTINSPGGAATTIEIYVLSVDGISGQTFFAAQGLQITKSDLLISDGAGGNVECQMNIIPQPMYMIGIGNVNTRPADNSFYFNPNAVGVMKDDARTAGSHFTNYPNFPPTFTGLGMRPSAVVGNSGGLQNSQCQSALCKPNGIQSNYDGYNNLRGNFSAHSSSKYTVIAPSGPTLIDYNLTKTKTLTAGDNLITSPFYIGAVNPMPNNVFTFKILKSAWGNDPTSFPQNYLILKYSTTTIVADIEEHCYIRSVTVDATHMIFNLRARNIQQMEVPLMQTDVTNLGDETYRGFLPPGNLIEAGSQVQLIYINDWVAFNSRIHLQWSTTVDENKTGTIGFTNNKNFYGNSDVNKPQLQTSQDWVPIYNADLIDPLIIDRYSAGGYYFLTQATEMLGLPSSVQGGLTDPTPYTNGVGFSQGLNEFPVGQMCTGQDINNPYFFSQYTNTISDIEGLWSYEKYLKQKTFIMEQNFQTPSSIGATWTLQASELTGAIDQATGNIMAPKEQVGLLQNEFITPVYGSNNQIGYDGRYITDLILYPESAGLEPGHCVGISGYDSNASYLATNILASLPMDVNDNSIYFVFFRTFFTIIRNYDPLKVKTGSTLPDRSPLKTLSTKAANIGNVNSSTTTPAVSGQVTLDGTPMIDVSGGTPAGNNATIPLFELGNPDPNNTTAFFFPSSSQEYPIRYIEQDGTGNLNRAKVSNYIGANNLTLAFQQDISAFGYTFFHQPYVTPFVDNSGGQVSLRVFFGNRKLGIFNHDAFGGVSVVNYARPDFPKNIFTFEEININESNGDYTNGTNPLLAVAPIGKRFLNKLGFSDDNLGITTNSSNQFIINSQNTRLGITTISNTRDIVLDDGTSTAFASFDTEVYGTTFSKLSSSDSILTSIPPPESSPGLASHVTITTPTHGKSNRIIQKFGDYIFYPYSINSSTDSFSTPDQVRYDNASSSFGTIGGLNLTSGTASRGMGTPNVLGSTTIVSQTTVPISLNPDCNIYLSYTIEADSNFINASNLPVKLNHGHMIVLSSIVQSPNYHLNNQGRLPGISIVNKTFLQGDYILSMGQLTFYAVKDQLLSEITTEIVNNDYTVPSSLGLQSTVIYEISNFNPKPATPPGTIFQKQQMAYLLNQQMQQMQSQQSDGGQPSKIQQLMGDLDKLGLGVLEDPNNNNSSVVNQLGNYIRSYDLVNLSPADRQQFYTSPQGQAFVQHAQSIMSMQRNLGMLDARFEEQEDLLGQGGDPRQSTYQQVLSELGRLPGLAPVVDVGVADAMVSAGALDYFDDDLPPEDPLEDPDVYAQVSRETPQVYDFEFDHVTNNPRFDPDRRNLRGEPRALSLEYRNRLRQQEGERREEERRQEEERRRANEVSLHSVPPPPPPDSGV